jgi:hypothetical protein
MRGLLLLERVFDGFPPVIERFINAGSVIGCAAGTLSDCATEFCIAVKSNSKEAWLSQAQQPKPA